MVLTFIYGYHKDSTYYFSAFIAMIAAIIMGYISTWNNAKILGKISLYEDEAKSIEMQVIPNQPKDGKEPDSQVNSISAKESNTTSDQVLNNDSEKVNASTMTPSTSQST